MAFASVISPEQANQAGDQTFELILTNWGNQGVGQDIDSNRYGSVPPTYTQINTVPPFLPPIIPIPNVLGQFTLPPVVSLAIAPDSHLDMVYFYAIEPFIPGFSKNIVTQRRVLSHDRPWFGRLPSPIIFTSNPFDFSTLVTNVTADSPLVQPDRTFNDTVQNEAGLPVAFGTTLGTEVFIRPKLNVLMYLGTPPSGVPIRRPFGDVFQGASLAATDIIRVWPVMGRRRIRLFVESFIGATSVRVTGVDKIGFAAFGVWRERLLAGPVALVAGGTTTFNLDNPRTDFLCLRVADAGISLRWNLEAWD